MRNAIFALALYAFLPAPAMASDPIDASVGRILVDGKDICNATLISPSIVLTAGHCLQPSGKTQPQKPENIHFLIKSAHDGIRRLFSARDIGLIPEFSYRDPNNPGITNMGNDIALVRLDGIATRSGFEQLSNRVKIDDRVKIPRAISHDRSPQGSEECLSHILPNKLMILSCSRDEGFSGSPVFIVEDGVRKVAAVVTAKSQRRQRNVLYAVVPQIKLSEIVWQRESASFQTQRLTKDALLR